MENRSDQETMEIGDNVFGNAVNIALSLVSELTAIPYGEIRFDKHYTSNSTGGFAVISAKTNQGQTTVDISGAYAFDRTLHKNDYILKSCICDFSIQIHCEAFQEGYNLSVDNKADFIDLYEKSIMLIDSLGFVERLGLDKVMYFNKINLQGTPLENDALFKAYSYSWHEAAKIALSEKTPTEKWQDFVAIIKQFCNSLDTGFKRFGLWENKTWQECFLGKGEN